MQVRGGVCGLCPLGSFCVNGTATECSPGSFQDQVGADTCVGCDPGWHRAEAGASTCLPCRPGLQCSDPTQAIVCPPGTYQPFTGAVACIQCHAGTYQPANASAHCLPCLSGHSCPIGSVVPSICPPGTYQELPGQSSCVTCADGFYQLQAGATTPCTPCPPGFACSDRALSPRPCQPGSMKAEPGQSSCVTCPSGRFQPATGQAACLECPRGSFCSNGAKQRCGKGQIADRPNLSSCSSCSTGFAANQTAHICQLCDQGDRCSSGVNNGPCPPGEYNSRGRCSNCGAGYFNPLSGAWSCQRCPPGHYCSSSYTQNPTPCAPGYFNPNQAQSSCTECPLGHYCPGTGSRLPIPCPPGTLQSSTKGVTCPFCPTGNYSLSQGSFNCHSCPSGYLCPAPDEPPMLSDRDLSIHTLDGKCPAGSYSSDGSCTPCNQGYYQPRDGAPACVVCPPGFRCENRARQPILCPSGYYSNTPAWLNSYYDKKYAGTCRPCPNGQVTTGPGSSGCMNCPIGYTCVDGYANACPTGHYRSSRDYIGSCKLCTKGYYQPNPAKDACITCPAGHYCGVGASIARPCPSGFYATSTGNFRCSMCPTGATCALPGTVAPITCPAGTYQPDGSGRSPCLACPDGHISGVGASTCTQCSPGHYCPDTQGTMLPCPAGSYQDEYGAIACKTCWLGSYPASDGATSCTVCQPGFYCPDPSKQPIPCSPGTYQDEYQATACKNCSADKFQPNSGQSSCITCPAGHYCPFLDTYQEPEPPSTCCSVNLTIPAASLLGLLQKNIFLVPTPLPCPAGTSSTAGDPNCWTCDASHFSGPGASVCSSCGEGAACPAPGMTAALPCPNGYAVSCSAESGCNRCSVGRSPGVGHTSCNGHPPDPNKPCVPVNALKKCLLGQDKCLVDAALEAESGGVYLGVQAVWYVATEGTSALSHIDGIIGTAGKSFQMGEDAAKAVISIKSLMDNGDKELISKRLIHAAHDAAAAVWDAVGIAAEVGGKVVGKIAKRVLKKVPLACNILTALDSDCVNAGAGLWHKIHGDCALPPLLGTSTDTATLSSQELQDLAVLYKFNLYTAAFWDWSRDHPIRTFYPAANSAACRSALWAAQSDGDDGNGCPFICPEEMARLRSLCSADLDGFTLDAYVADVNAEQAKFAAGRLDGTIVGYLSQKWIQASRYIDPDEPVQLNITEAQFAAVIQRTVQRQANSLVSNARATNSTLDRPAFAQLLDTSTQTVYQVTPDHPPPGVSWPARVTLAIGVQLPSNAQGKLCQTASVRSLRGKDLAWDILETEPGEAATIIASGAPNPQPPTSPILLYCAWQ